MNPPETTRYDVVIVGGGHNALVAAAYLARAGRSVVVLERQDAVGGAAVSERPWPGVDARLSRYSYLVSLLPQKIIDDGAAVPVVVGVTDVSGVPLGAGVSVGAGEAVAVEG